MHGSFVEGARARLDHSSVRDDASAIADRLAVALARGEDATAHPTAHGGIVYYLSARRALELDRAGTLVTALDWDGRGALGGAFVRSALGDRIAIEPGAGPDPPGGASGRLWRVLDGPEGRTREPLTAFEWVDWGRITHIPTLAEPGRLPSGTGTAVLNLLAQLARDQGVERLRYRGPYATESLFLALLESFRFVGGDADPLGRFREGALDWTPAPHERHSPRADVCVQLRAGVEKVVWQGRTYYRTTWQSVTRHAPRRVRDVDGGVRCSLWALGVPIEDHAVLDPDGNVLAAEPPSPDPRPPAPLDPAVRAGLVALIRAMSAAALADSIDVAAAGIAFEWGGLTADLAAITGARARISWRLVDVGAARIRATATPADRLGRALELLTEMARLLGDPMRALAQSALAAAAPEAQEAALATSPAPVGDAKAIAAAAATLVEQFTR